MLPRLTAAGAAAQRQRWLPAVSGGLSSASWVYASFVGVARPLSPVVSFTGFMALYAAAVGVALVLALLTWRALPQRAPGMS